MMSRAVGSLVACVLFVCISQSAARSAELKIFASRAIWTVLTEIGPEFEKNSGHKLDVSTGLSSEFVRRIISSPLFAENGRYGISSWPQISRLWRRQT